MKKLWGILVTFLLLAACAEMPAWWTPSQHTGGNNPAGQTAKPEQPALQNNPTPTMEELELSLTDETYEEMALTPLQDDENDSGETSAQSVPPEDEDVLPPPSILEE